MVIRNAVVRPRLWVSSASTPWILALTLTKAGDLATTVVGLAVLDGLSERNPVAATIYAQFGVAGLLWLTLCVLGFVVFVVEYAATTIDEEDDTELSGDAAYFLGYLPLVTLFTAVTAYNAVVLCLQTLS